MRYFIKLAYDGTNYHGWQVQENAVTVQSELEKALSVLLQHTIEVTGAGRTDTGVHAREYYAHFDVENEISFKSLDNLAYRLNAILPSDISVFSVFSVNPDVHARFTATSRMYKYYITKSKNPFNKQYAWQALGHLDMAKMNEAAKVLFEYIDFTSFSKLHTDVKTNNCHIMQAEWTEENDLLVFTITADRFLRNMVRAIVGTLVDVGRGKMSIEDFRAAIEKKDRNSAGYSVPAKGLFLEKIDYPEDILIA